MIEKLLEKIESANDLPHEPPVPGEQSVDSTGQVSMTDWTCLIPGQLLQMSRDFRSGTPKRVIRN